MTNHQAIRAYRRFQLDPRVGWMDEPAGLEEKWFAFGSADLPAPHRWMDAYLSSCAQLIGARLVTFDLGFRQFESHGLDLAVLAGSGKA